MSRLKPGSEAPGFSLLDEKGKTVSLNDFRGKIVYLDFWGVGCSPCIYQIKNHLPEFHKKYKDKDVIVVNICVDANEKEWKQGLEKYHPEGINLIAKGWTDHPVCQAYYISSIPHNVLIDRNGKIINNNAPAPSVFDLRSGDNVIDKLLK